jgi:hypothetical protein
MISYPSGTLVTRLWFISKRVITGGFAMDGYTLVHAG